MVLIEFRIYDRAMRTVEIGSGIRYKVTIFADANFHCAKLPSKDNLGKYNN